MQTMRLIVVLLAAAVPCLGASQAERLSALHAELRETERTQADNLERDYPADETIRQQMRMALEYFRWVNAGWPQTVALEVPEGMRFGFTVVKHKTLRSLVDGTPPSLGCTEHLMWVPPISWKLTSLMDDTQTNVTVYNWSIEFLHCLAGSSEAEMWASEAAYHSGMHVAFGIQNVPGLLKVADARYLDVLYSLAARGFGDPRFVAPLAGKMKANVHPTIRDSFDATEAAGRIVALYRDIGWSYHDIWDRRRDLFAPRLARGLDQVMQTESAALDDAGFESAFLRLRSRFPVGDAMTYTGDFVAEARTLMPATRRKDFVAAGETVAGKVKLSADALLVLGMAFTY